MLGPDYTVHLERVFQGPLDLLLHLVREQEVEIHEIELTKVIDGYLQYLGTLQEIDLELAGDFVVMASVLMAIKSRSLLPREDVDLGAELDPRDELIQRLIEYRRFKKASEALAKRCAERGLLHERGWMGEVAEIAPEALLDLTELTAFDLLSCWSRLLRETNATKPHRVNLDRRSLRYYVEELAGRLQQRRSATLQELVESLDSLPRREALVGSFCALLELVRLGVVKVRQAGVDREIEVEMLAEDAAGLEALLQSTRLDDEGETYAEQATVALAKAQAQPSEAGLRPLGNDPASTSQEAIQVFELSDPES